MDDHHEEILRLHEKLDELLKRQASFKKEVTELRYEINRLALPGPEPEVHDQKPGPTPEIKVEESYPAPPVKKEFKIRSDLEKFVGENLINKIGIVITVLGVGIGAKYAIDHDLISPWTRIILGYLVGLGLFGFAIRLKKQYLNFSSVLLSGSMAIMYFITYAAFSFYNLVPFWLTFALMVMFTVFTVTAAITCNQQVIAHLGLVGAYAVPFLLSNDTGNVAILFSYMALINTGILFIALKKYWKPLYYSSSAITWVIVISWYSQSYQPLLHFSLALSFILVFFTIFYVIFLAYKLLKTETFGIEDILMILGNSSVFYALGYSIVYSHLTGNTILGLFTMFNALVHLIVSIVIYRRKQADRNLMYFTGGLALVFVTIAIPVGLDGTWVTLLWTAEAAMLFWLGRTKNTILYELLSYPLMFLAFFSLMHDWLTHYNFFGNEISAGRMFPVFNIIFLTSLMLIASLTFISILNRKTSHPSPLFQWQWLLNTINFSIPAMLLIVAYGLFVMEISTFWNQRYMDSVITLNTGLTVNQHIRNTDVLKYNTISLIDYSLLFFSILSIMNIIKLKNSILGYINLGCNTIAIGVFLTIGLYTIGELRDSYLGQPNAAYFYRGGFNIGIRYVSFVFTGGMLFLFRKYIRQKFIEADLKLEFDFLLHITLLTLLSNELINWMDLFKSEHSYKLGLSILWGIYALLLIALGIWKKKKHLRIGAIVLFSATLVKLFLYDIVYLDTISKTIVFVSLGLLLLIISFLYNKYRKLIF
ncbi:MAG: DUF2339 domain-containing protein [Bacteroidetes bacterium]|nr:DUF2339 domain-containing protein [Bacteroidota bacterium]